LAFPSSIMSPIQILDTQRLAAASNSPNQLSVLESQALELSDFNSTPAIPCNNASLQLAEEARVTADPVLPNQMLILESQAPHLSDLNSSSVTPQGLLNSDLVPVAPSCGISVPSNNSLEDFIMSISEDPEPPLIRSQPNTSFIANSSVEGGSVQPAVDVGVISSPIGKRSSARLAAKKKMKIGRNRNAIVKAQEILLAKLNNSASSHFQNSKASVSNDQVDLIEQLARHFSRPLTKEQMEAIMELATQGKEKEGTKKKGSKVTPLKAPIIEAAEML
jgi:molybdopterin-binding protein